MSRIAAGGSEAETNERAATDAMTDAEPHLAIVKLSAMGDVIHALPGVHLVRRTWPRARITWIVQREIAPLLEPMRWLDEVIPFDRRGGWRAIVALHRRLRAAARIHSFDCAIDLQGNTKSGFVTRLSGAPRRVGLHRDDQRERSNRWFLTEHVPRRSQGHVVERALDATAFVLGCERPALRAIPWDAILDLREEERERAQRWPPFDRGCSEVVVIHPTPRGDVRGWPPERHAELATRLLRREGVHVLFLGGPGEIDESRWLATQVDHPRAHHVIGHRDLRELLALHAATRTHRHVVVGTDCGPVQAALAAGCRTLFLHGPQDPGRTGPWDPRDRWLSANRSLACRPCLARRCRHPEGPVCLTDVGVDEVHDAVRDLLIESGETWLPDREHERPSA
ncbi:MAG: glycosyltransferase family 9 protein [Planctomycetes bacterium]|nr:glycosyltransferase family 9 protein [Planctomycetota bacterium]